MSEHTSPLFLHPINSEDLCNSVVTNISEEDALCIDTIQIPISSNHVRKACHFAIDDDHHYFVGMI